MKELKQFKNKINHQDDYFDIKPQYESYRSLNQIKTFQNNLEDPQRNDKNQCEDKGNSILDPVLSCNQHFDN